MYINGPRIVSDGLVLYLDAGNRKSYPESGTDWLDLSGNLYSGSLINGPTFDGANGGGISFDGVNDYVANDGMKNVGSLMGNGFSYSYWINTTTTAGVVCVVGVLSSDTGMNWSSHLNEGITDTTNVGKTSWYLRDSGDRSTNGYISTNIYDGKWHHVMWTCPSTVIITNVRAYVDGVEQTITATTTATLSTYANFNQTVTFGARNIRGVIQRWANMKLAQFMYYTRQLSANEVLQNYNATRSRFGV